MLKTIITLKVLVISIIISGCSYWTIRGTRYRTLDSFKIPDVGNYGKVDKSQENRYVPHANPEKLGNAIVYISTNVFDRKSSKKAAKVLREAGKSNLSLEIGGAGEEQGKFLIFDIEYRSLKSILNEDQHALSFLINWGDSARVITSFARVYEHDKIKKIITKLDLDKRDKVKLSLSNETEKEFRFSDGTVYAYEMSHICWTYNSRGEKEKIFDFVPDKPGSDLKCTKKSGKN